MTLSLQLFGGASLEDDGGGVTGPAVQRHRIALLALLAVSPSGAMTRDKLMALLWPERDDEHARKLLNQSVYVLRRVLGQRAIVSAGEELRLDTAVVRCDVVDFKEALAAGDLERAVELYAGPFLDGFHLSDTPEFERWLDGERAQLAACYAEALEELAEAAAGRGDVQGAVAWWQARAAHDPFDSRVALRLVRALGSAGNPAGALRHAAVHERLLREELGIEMPPEIADLVERLRREPSAGEPAKVREVDRPAAGGSTFDEVREPAEVEARPRQDLPDARGTSPEAGEGKRFPRSAIRYGFAALLLLVAIVAAIRWESESRGSAAAAADGPEIAVDEIARAVARELERRQRGDTAVRRPEHRTRSIAAYELYLRGSDPAMLRSDTAARRALEHYRRAIALDSSYAAAWAGLARLSLRVGSAELRGVGRPEVYAQAEEAALRAVALDDSLAEAHAALGLVRMAEFDLPSAENRLERAIDLDPDASLFRQWLAGVYLWTGRPGEALAQAERALELDPLSPAAHAEVARALAANDRCDEAFERLGELAGLEPPLLRVPTIVANCHVRSRRWADALATLRAAPGAGDPLREAQLGFVLAASGRLDEAGVVRDTLLARLQRGESGAFPVAVVSAGLGDLDAAFGWLDRSLEDGSLLGSPPHFTVAATVLERLRPDPRFERLSERLGL